MTTCQVGDTRSLGVQADAPWEEVLDAILIDANRHRSSGGQVSLDSYEAARDFVPPQLPIEYIRAVNGRFGVCTRVGVGDGARGGLSMFPVSFARTFGAGVDPTDPWTALVMVVAVMRRTAAARLAQYGQMWLDALSYSGDAKGTGLRVANAYRSWYDDNPPWKMTQMAREAGYRSTIQFRGWITTPDVDLGEFVAPGQHGGGSPPSTEWPIALAYDLDFWGIVLAEMFLESEYPGRGTVLADQLWRGITNVGNDGLWGYYDVPNGLSYGLPSDAAAASLCHDGIVWVRPLVQYARALLAGYGLLPASVRRAMGFSGTDIELLQGTLGKVPVVLARVPEWLEYGHTLLNVSGGAYILDGVGGEERHTWSQPGVVTSYVKNPMGVPIEELYDTLAPFDHDASVSRWAGYQMVPPLPPPSPPPTPPSVRPEPPVQATKPISPIIPLAFGLAIPILGYWVGTTWRKPK